MSNNSNENKSEIVDVMEGYSGTPPKPNKLEIDPTPKEKYGKVDAKPPKIVVKPISPAPPRIKKQENK